MSDHSDKVARLSEDERMEYEEIGNIYRHHDTIAYQMAATVLPLAFGAVPLAVDKSGAVKAGLMIFSVAIYGHWLAMCERIGWYNDVRHMRAKVLEAKANLAHHRLFDAEEGKALRAKMKPVRQSWLGKLRIRWVRMWIVSGLLVLAWVIVMITPGGSRHGATAKAGRDTVYVVPADTAAWRSIVSTALQGESWRRQEERLMRSEIGGK